MSRYFTTSAQRIIQWLGFRVDRLPEPYKSGTKAFFAPGGSAEQKLGKIKEVYIKSRDGNPIHQSSYNPQDKEWIISARVVGSKDTKTCHIYPDGTGTIKKGDRRR